MKYRTHRQMMRRQADLRYAIMAVVAMLLFIGFVGWLESTEKRDMYEHCMFLAMPDDTIEQVKECARETGYFPAEYNQRIWGGVK